jgi:hypothetical protein
MDIFQFLKLDKRTDYKGKEFAEIVKKEWNKNFKIIINFVVGE